MKTGPASTLKALRRRSWRGAVLFAWLALVFVNLAGALSVQAASGLTEAEIQASICHVGKNAEDGAAAPETAQARHCPLCLVMGSGQMVPPPGQIALGRLPVPVGMPVLSEAPESGLSSLSARTASPRAPPILT